MSVNFVGKIVEIWKSGDRVIKMNEMFFHQSPEENYTGARVVGANIFGHIYPVQEINSVTVRYWEVNLN